VLDIVTDVLPRGILPEVGESRMSQTVDTEDPEQSHDQSHDPDASASFNGSASSQQSSPSPPPRQKVSSQARAGTQNAIKAAPPQSQALSQAKAQVQVPAAEKPQVFVANTFNNPIARGAYVEREMTPSPAPSDASDVHRYGF
jgi:hypothetical protein